MLPIDILFLAYCTYVPFLLVLYLAECWIIIKPGGQFKGSFYYLFLATAIVDMIMVVFTWPEFRMVSFPLVNRVFENYDGGAFTRFRITLSYICPFTQDLLNCFVALNRFTSIRMAVHHRTLWEKLLPASIIGCYLVSILIFIGPGFRKVGYLKIKDDDYTVYFANIDATEVWPWFNLHILFTVEMFITNIIVLVLYFMAARSLRRLVSGSTTSQQERMLLRFGIINCLVALPGALVQAFGFEIAPPQTLYILFQQYGWIMDIKCFCASVTMVYVNSAFRQELLTLFGVTKLKELLKQRPAVSPPPSQHIVVKRKASVQSVFVQH